MDKKKILVIDDERDFTDRLKLHLELKGSYEVKTENKSVHALRTTRQFRPDLILLDIMMPEKSGEDVAREIKQDKSLEDIPIIFLTAIVSSEEVSSEKGIIGGYPFIAKPVKIDNLAASIEEYIKR